jgi:hypothetical protein
MQGKEFTCPKCGSTDNTVRFTDGSEESAKVHVNNPKVHVKLYSVRIRKSFLGGMIKELESFPVDGPRPRSNPQ